MMSLAARCLPLLIAAIGAPALGQAIPCGEPYTVQRGDTLQRIAVRAYGPGATFRDLLEPNRDLFRNGNPSLIEVGQKLVIPCRPAEAGASGALPDQSPQPPLRAAPLLKVGSWIGESPWAVLTAALERASLPMPPAAPAQPEADVVAEALEQAGAGAVAAPVPRFDCSAPGLPAEATAFCNQLAWSVPLAETVVATFTRAETGPVTLDSALADRRVCIAGTMPRYLVTARGLGGRGGLLEIAADAAACFTQLRAGTVDAAIMPAVEADGVIESLPPGTAVIEQFALSQLVTLHAVALPTDPTSVAKLAALDEALAAMRADGSWLALATGATAPR